MHTEILTNMPEGGVIDAVGYDSNGCQLCICGPVESFHLGKITVYDHSWNARQEFNVIEIVPPRKYYKDPSLFDVLFNQPPRACWTPGYLLTSTPVPGKYCGYYIIQTQDRP